MDQLKGQMDLFGSVSWLYFFLFLWEQILFICCSHCPDSSIFLRTHCTPFMHVMSSFQLIAVWDSHSWCKNDILCLFNSCIIYLTKWEQHISWKWLNKQTYGWKWPGTRTGLKRSEKAAIVWRKTLKDYHKACRITAQDHFLKICLCVSKI